MTELIAALALLMTAAVLWLTRKLIRRTEPGRMVWDRFFRPLDWLGDMGKRFALAFINSRPWLKSTSKVLETMVPIPMIVLLLSASDIRLPGTNPISDGWAAAWLAGSLVGIAFCKKRVRAIELRERQALIAEIKALSEDDKPAS